MADNSRIDDLRRRVQKDPASIAFAQLAEECRRSGNHQEAVETCRAGLAIHPEYLSARVTLGRALLEMGEVDEAYIELARVLESAPENLAAIRGLAEIHHRRGDLAEALVQYRAALLLARNDPELEETIADLSRKVEPGGQEPAGGLTLLHMQDELLKLAPPPQHAAETTVPAAFPASSAVAVSSEPTDSAVARDVFSLISTTSAVDRFFAAPPEDGTLTASADNRAGRTLAALEQWLAAIHAPRQERYL
jgi:tetratricopeptide (TPR) repeat protein